ncbi:MAG: hypothetical protein LLG42_04840 [Chloroflexi bacterium]|nr:hypothetical protein [Chloroflexota bacterium]
MTSDQREDTRNEEYTITFEEGNDIYSYTTNGYLEYLEFTPGSKWLLSVNAFGKITDLQSAD